MDNMNVEVDVRSGRVIKQLKFTPKSESERRDWKNEQHDLEYHVNPENRCAFIYGLPVDGVEGPGPVTMLMFKNTFDMMEEIEMLQEEIGEELDVHYQD